MKRYQAAMALLLTALMTAASCQSTAESVTTTADMQSSTPTTEEADVFAGLPDTTFDGREFNFLVRETELDDYFVEEATGDILDDAIYRRNTEVEQKYDVVINHISIDGSWASRDTYLGAIRNSVMSGSGEYDLIDGYAAVIGGGFADKIFMNLWEVPNLRLDEDWWSEIIANELTVNGKLYAMTGDLAINMWSNLHALYFNKTLIENYGRQSPYDRVKDGSWTIDSFLSDIKDVSSDLDNDGVITENDQIGWLVYDSLSFDNLHNAFDIPLSSKDSSGIPTLELENERLVNAVELILKLPFENPDVLYMEQSNPDIIPDSRNLFMSGRAMYFSDTLEACTLMRESDTEFGILPLPKYDESQTGYYTTSRDGRSMFVIPVDVKDADFTGLITEALAVASNKYVVPAYYDVTLKTKTARDDESSEMLDIIRDGFRLEFVAEYAIQTNNSGYVIRNCITGSSTTPYSSTVASNLNSYNEALAKFLEAYN